MEAPSLFDMEAGVAPDESQETPAKSAVLPARAELLAFARKLSETWKYPALVKVRIGYNQRLRSTLGRAILCPQPGRCQVELNTRLLHEHPGEVYDVLAHELAHVVGHFRDRRGTAHGKSFRELMKVAGYSPQATHDLPTEHLRRKRRKYLYLHHCGDCGYTFIARNVKRNCYCVACGPEMAWDIFRAPNTVQGRARLKEMQTASVQT